MKHWLSKGDPNLNLHLLRFATKVKCLEKITDQIFLPNGGEFNGDEYHGIESKKKITLNKHRPLKQGQPFSKFAWILWLEERSLPKICPKKNDFILAESKATSKDFPFQRLFLK